MFYIYICLDLTSIYLSVCLSIYKSINQSINQSILTLFTWSTLTSYTIRTILMVIQETCRINKHAKQPALDATARRSEMQ